jgi:hypothetical protein
MSLSRPAALLLPLLATACPKIGELAQPTTAATTIEQADACAEALRDARMAYQEINPIEDEHAAGYGENGGPLVDPTGANINDVYDTSDHGFYQMQVVDADHAMVLTRQGIYPGLLPDGTIGIDPNATHDFNLNGADRPDTVTAEKWISGSYNYFLDEHQNSDVFQSSRLSETAPPDNETQAWLDRFNSACEAHLSTLEATTSASE